MLLIKKQTAQLIIAEQTGQTLEQIGKTPDRDRWFTADEAKEYGFIDHVVRSARDVATREAPHEPRTTTRVGGTVTSQPSPVTSSRSSAERSANGERVRPYTKLFEERIIFLGVQIDDASADDVMAQLLCLESMDPDRDISIYINSPGGSYTAMTAIYDTIRFVKPEVQTGVSAKAASAAAVLLRSRVTRPSATHCRTRGSLSHQPYSGAVVGIRHRDPGQRDPPDAYRRWRHHRPPTGRSLGHRARHRARQDPHG